MRLKGLVAVAAIAFPLGATAQDGDVSVERGRHVSIIGGCHDCHTANYNETAGQIDPDAALQGIPVGFRGPWGTTYAKNLRLTVADLSEDEWVEFAQTFEALPPMPYYNVHAMDEGELRSLYAYIRSLGAPGEAMPETVPPGEEPTTPFVVMAPPTMP